MLLATKILFCVFVVLLGACLASFWALVAFRKEHQISWWRGRSFCDHCHQQIAWWENIPIFSYLVLGGKCRHCHTAIPPLYWWWEVILGGWTLIWFWHLCPLAVYFDTHNFDVGLQPLITVIGGWWPLWRSLLIWLLGAILGWTALVDIKTKKVDVGWLWTAAIITGLAVIGDFLTGSLTVIDIGWRLLGSVGIGVVFVAIDWVARKVWQQTGIGSGDQLMVMTLAWWLTPLQLLVMFLVSFWLGALVGVGVLLAAKKYQCESTLPFLPFVVCGFAVAVFWGEELGQLLLGL